MKGRIAAVSTPLLLLLSLSIAGAHDGGSSGYASLAVDGLEVRYTLTLWPRPLGAPVAGELEQVRAGDAAATRRWIDLVREKVRVAAAGVPCSAGEGRAELTKPATETMWQPG